MRQRLSRLLHPWPQDANGVLLVLCSLLSLPTIGSPAGSVPVPTHEAPRVPPANNELRALLPRTEEVTPWAMVGDMTKVALQPDALGEVYGTSAGFFRDWRALSAVSGRYRYNEFEVVATVACLASPRDALLLFAHVREAAEIMGRTTSLQIGQAAYWRETENALYAGVVKDNFYATLEFAPAGRAAQTAVPRFLSAFIKRLPRGMCPFTLWVNGQLVRIDTPLVGEAGIQIPLRPVFSYLGYDALWIEKTQDVVFVRLPSTVAKDARVRLPATVKLRINDKDGSVDNQRFSLKVAPFTFDGLVYGTPEIFEVALNKKVRWDAASRRLELND